MLANLKLRTGISIIFLTLIATLLVSTFTAWRGAKTSAASNEFSRLAVELNEMVLRFKL
ncbi:MAG: hypothetical protein ACK5NQ_12165 [Pseudomonas sp.]